MSDENRYRNDGSRFLDCEDEGPGCDQYSPRCDGEDDYCAVWERRALLDGVP